jgi:uncharacterized membrane protein YgcG
MHHRALLSDEYYPHADALLRYLQAFADAMLPERIAYRTEVRSIVKRKAPDRAGGWPTGENPYYFDVKTSGGGGGGGEDGGGYEGEGGAGAGGMGADTSWTCGKVIVATGLSKPNRLPVGLDR